MVIVSKLLHLLWSIKKALYLLKNIARRNLKRNAVTRVDGAEAELCSPYCSNRDEYTELSPRRSVHPMLFNTRSGS